MRHMIQRYYDLVVMQHNFIVPQRFIQTLTLKNQSGWKLTRKSIGRGRRSISGNSSSITIDCNDNFNVHADTLISFTCGSSSFSGNLDVGSGLDVTGNITCSGILDIEGDIHMASGKKIQWVNTGTYISGTDTALTIDADDTMSLNADNTMTLTCPTINLSGNANVSNGLDVTGIITCSSMLDIEGNIEMANAGQKIQWVNADTYISGGDTSLQLIATI